MFNRNSEPCSNDGLALDILGFAAIVALALAMALTLTAPVEMRNLWWHVRDVGERGGR